MIRCLLAFFAASAVSYSLTFAVRRLATRYGALDRPQARKVHEQPVPTWGGLGIFGGALLGTLVFTPVTREFGGVLLGALVLVGSGMIDDRFDMRAGIKLLAQILAAFVLLAFGVRIAGFSSPLTHSYHALLPYQGWLLTVVWVVGITNALNLIDGLDGLAAGVSALSAMTLAVLAFQQNHRDVAVLAAALSGACVGFLRHNFNPARIFMGDTGSQMLGFVLAAVSVAGTVKKPALVTLLLPLVVLGVPVLDATLAVIRRSRRGVSIFRADREHLHHRLMNRGLNQRQVVVMLYAATVALCAVALTLARFM